MAEREASSAELAALRATIQKLESQLQEKPPPGPVISEKEAEERRRAEEKAAQEILQLKEELQALQKERESFCKERDDLSASLLEQEEKQEECVHQAVSQVTSALRAEVDEERRKYQGLLREFTRLEQRYDNLREMSLLTERTKGHRRTDSTQSLEPLSPSTPLSPQSLTPLSISPFPSAVPSPEEVRRISVTSPSAEKRVSVWSSEASMEQLMEKMDVAKDPSVKMKGEDLAHAYDAVRVANKFLESQLRNQCSQWEKELETLRSQLAQAVSVSSSAAQRQDVQELLEARERECVRLRRELKELRNTVSLRRLLTQVFPSALATETSSPAQSKPAAVTGLLECRKRDETKLIKNLVTDIRVDSALSLAPGLPASVLFLCVRQADCSGDQARARSLCSAAVTAMKAALKKHVSDIDMAALWLKNICLFHDLLTQHSPKQAGSAFIYFLHH
ncbi:unconventional myosin-Va-like [Simochromis diagramma]|uniref:unconventional myosin-Va-like n=1 Tax=Simochromis diagramma TaxID=43689 RepID=UPI001A7EA60E|nr:unconventional myosin-Va-like [Simochromis diagramma]